MDWNEQQKAYVICKLRGHQPSGIVFDTFPPYEQCKFCGTTYRYERVLEEAKTPFGWVADLRQKPDSEEFRIVFGYKPED